MTDRDIYIAHWNRLWLLHYDNAPWVHLEEGWIDEAVELAKEFSTDESGSFVNGVLGRVSRTS